MVKDYLTQQIILLDNINTTLDDMLELAKQYSHLMNYIDTEGRQLQQQGVYMMESIRHKMMMLGIL